jgi:hypothetical protein
VRKFKPGDLVVSNWERDFPDNLRLRGIVVSIRDIPVSYDHPFRNYLISVIWANYHRSDPFDYYEDELMLIVGIDE